MSESGGDKKHDATPYRRQKAREQGQIARSQDLGSALVLLIAVSVLGWWGPTVGQTLANLMISVSNRNHTGILPVARQRRDQRKFPSMPLRSPSHHAERLRSSASEQLAPLDFSSFPKN